MNVVVLRKVAKFTIGILLCYIFAIGISLYYREEVMLSLVNLFVQWP